MIEGGRAQVGIAQLLGNLSEAIGTAANQGQSVEDALTAYPELLRAIEASGQHQIQHLDHLLQTLAAIAEVTGRISQETPGEATVPLKLDVLITPLGALNATLAKGIHELDHEGASSGEVDLF